VDGQSKTGTNRRANLLLDATNVIAGKRHVAERLSFFTRSSIAQRLLGGIPMFGWFQRLLPRRGDFFGMFEAHAATLVGAADALDRLSNDGMNTAEVLKTIRDREHEADEVIRQVLTAVRMTFLTPFDRGAITSLIGAMDDAIDEMLAAARAIDLYELRELRPEMQQMVKLIVKAAKVTSEAVPLLRNITSDGARLHWRARQTRLMPPDSRRHSNRPGPIPCSLLCHERSSRISSESWTHSRMSLTR
jgi:hypothetical protein